MGKIRKSIAALLLSGALAASVFFGCEKKIVETNTELQTDTVVVNDTVVVEDSTEVTLPVDFFENKKTLWVDYAPTNFNPDVDLFPSKESIRQDLQVLADHNYTGIVTYGSDSTLRHVPEIANELGIKNVIMGIWSPTSTEEWNNAIAAAPFVKGYCLGNEGLSAGRYTLDELAQKVKNLREQTHKPVATTEALGEYNDDLLKVGDWVFPNVHPYWAGINDPEAAATWTKDQHIYLSALTDKLVVLKEVGLPSAGDAGMTEENQNNYYRKLEDLMDGINEESFIYFEAFDQDWKDWAPVEPYWGLFDKDRNEKAVSEPDLLFTYVPPYGSYHNVRGKVVNMDPSEFKICTFIKVGSTWWMKPYWSRPLTTIGSDGNWSVDYTTGGIDQNASKINCYLVSPDFVPVKHSPPSLTDPKVFDMVSAAR